MLQLLRTDGLGDRVIRDGVYKAARLVVLECMLDLKVILYSAVSREKNKHRETVI